MRPSNPESELPRSVNKRKGPPPHLHTERPPQNITHPISYNKSRNHKSTINQRNTITFKQQRTPAEITEREALAMERLSSSYRHYRTPQLDIRYATQSDTPIGCRIIEWNGDGRLKTNGPLPYVEHMKAMKGDILFILDTGLNHRDCEFFGIDVQNIDPTLTIKFVPAIPNDNTAGRAVGGILAIINHKWALDTGEMHQDNSKLGLLCKMQIRGRNTTYTLICCYWPMPTTGSDRKPNKVWNKLQSWLSKNRITDSPLKWLQRVISKWLTVAQTSQHHNKTIILGDLNSSIVATRKGSHGTHGSLQPFLDENQLVSVYHELFPRDTIHPTYWTNTEGISIIDHFLVHQKDTQYIHNVFIDIGSDTLQLSAHKPLGVDILTQPKLEDNLTPPLDPPLPVELQINRDDSGQLMESIASKAMNRRLKQFVSESFEQWQDNPSSGLADRMLFQINKLSTETIRKSNNDQHHKYKGKPHGWSPEQVILYAQLAALVEIRRRMYGLSGRTQWTRQQVKKGIHSITSNWRNLLKQFKKDPTHCRLFVGFTPNELENAPPERLTRSLLDDMIETVNSHLHYARRKQMRETISDRIHARERAFATKKIKKVLNSVLQKNTPRFNYNSVSTQNGKVVTDPKEIQKELNTTFQKWHAPTHLVDLAAHISNTPGLWQSFDDQNKIPLQNTVTDLPDKYIKLFTEALLYTRDDQGLFEEMRDALHQRITLAEFIKAIKLRTNSKAPGITGCSINMIKQWSEEVIEFVYELMNHMWEDRYIPPWWRDKWVVLIPKVDTPIIPTNKLRPISLLETTRKIWTAIIMTRIMGVLNKRQTLQSMQAGFTSGKSTDNCLLQFINAIEQAEQDHSPLYYVSYDISKAFDRPPKGILKMCWHRVGVPEDIVEWLINLDIDGRSYIKSPWAQNKIKNGELITDTDCEYFTAVTGVPQGSSEGAIAWIIIFDVLLTMLHLGECTNFLIKNAQGTLCPQEPTAFADDLLTYAATLAQCQRQAKIVSSFCMLTGLEIAPAKMTARVIYPPEKDTLKPMELRMWTITGDRVTVPIHMGSEESELLRYLGIHIEHAHTWNGQLSILIDKVAETVRVLTHTRASSAIKWCAISTSSYAGITYPAKYAPWSLDEYDRLVNPLRQILRSLTHNRTSIPAHLITGSPRYGCVGLPDLNTRIQHEKYKMVQRAQESGGLVAAAVNSILERVADYNSIPHTVGSPILFTHMDKAELKKAKNWISSTVEYTNDEVCGLGRTGLIQIGTRDERIPRPIHGTPENGSVAWLASRDIMTLGDATYRVDDHTEWLQEQYEHNEPRWWEAVTNRNPPIGALTLRRGHILINTARTEIYEFMGVLATGDINYRPWASHGDPYREGTQIWPTETYRGVAGRQIVIDTESFRDALRIVYKMETNGSARITHISNESINNGSLRIHTPKQRITPWVQRLSNDLRSTFGDEPIECYVDGSYKSGPLGKWTDITSSTPPQASAGMVFVPLRGNWRISPLIAVHIQDGHDIAATSVFPMELLALTSALVVSANFPTLKRVISDSQSSIDTVRPALASPMHKFGNYGQPHITLACRDDLPTALEVEVAKVRSHVEDRIADEFLWTRDEQGNVLADLAASHKPDRIKEKNPNAIVKRIKAEEMIAQISPPHVWNIYMKDGKPTTWEQMQQKREDRLQQEYVIKRSLLSKNIGRNRDWTQKNMALASHIWKTTKQTSFTRGRTMKILYDHYWHGGNRAKAAKSPSEKETLQTCDLCGMIDSQNHILNHCSHPAMLALRENAHHQIISHLQSGAKDTSIDGSDKIYHTLHMIWTASTPTPELWIGRWDRTLTDSFTNKLVKFQYKGTEETILETIRSAYHPIIGYTYLAHTLRVALLLSDGKVDILTGPELIVGHWYKDIRLPSGPLHDSITQSVDSDWMNPETGEGHSQRVKNKRRKRTKHQTSIKTGTLAKNTSSDRYYYEERTIHTRNPDTILARKRYTSMSADAVATLIAQKDTESLNKLAQARRLEGTDIARITVDTEGVGLCLISTKKIQATESKPIKLWEYTGEVKPVHNDENSNSIPLRELKFGCEYTDGGQTFRRTPTDPLDGLSQYIQSPKMDEKPNCYFMLDDHSKKTYVMLTRTILPNEKYTISYGLQYWQLFWTHLPTSEQQTLKRLNPTITFPPLWPPQIPLHPKRIDYMREEWNYAIASINIYDELMDDPEAQSPRTDAQLSEDGETPEDDMQSVVDVALTPTTCYHDTTRDTKTPTTPVPFNPDNWCKLETQNRHGADNMIRALDVALRWKHSSKIPRRSIVRYRLLLVESMRHFHIHDIPLPVDGTTTVQEVCLEHNHMDAEIFFQQLQHTQEDGNAIMIDDYLGETLYDATVAHLSERAQIWFRSNQIAFTTTTTLMRLPVRPTTCQILALNTDGSVDRWIRTSDREQHIYHRIKPLLKHQNDQYLPLADVLHISLELTPREIPQQTQKEMKQL